MSGGNVLLPKSLDLGLDGLSLQAIGKNDGQLFTAIYSDIKLMQHLNDSIDTTKIQQNFEILINEVNQTNPMFISYIIQHKSNKLGILGVKLLQSDELELGVIIKHGFQGQGWSKRIKKAVIKYAFERLEISRIIAYCKHDNGAANHVNQSLDFALEKQFIHKSKGHLMNKWVLT